MRRWRKPAPRPTVSPAARRGAHWPVCRSAERSWRTRGGGAPAPIAWGMVPLAPGSDGGASIRIPACWTGCFGHKPSFGRIPMGPFQMLGWVDASVFGPITRTVRDAAMYMDAVVGAHESDPNSLPHPGYSYVEVLERLPKGLGIAWSPDPGSAAVEPDVLREAAGAARAFEKLGHRVDEVGMVFDDPGLIWGPLSSP